MTEPTKRLVGLICLDMVAVPIPRQYTSEEQPAWQEFNPGVPHYFATFADGSRVEITAREFETLGRSWPASGTERVGG